MYCMGCHQSICHGDCLARHRDRYACHNPQCFYHVPSPLRPEPGSEPAGENHPADATELAATTTTATENNDMVDGNLVFRETITREWRLVDGQLAQVPGQSIRLRPVAVTTTSTGTQTTVSRLESEQGDTLRPETDSTGAAGVPISDIVTDEEIKAQAQLWAQFQPSQRGSESVLNERSTPS